MKHIYQCTSNLPKILCLFLLLAPCLHATNADDTHAIEALFAKAPRKVLPLLDSTTRLDLIDLYNNHLNAKCENLYGGQTELISKDSHSILLRTSSIGEWRMVILPNSTDTIIMTLHSIFANGRSTAISFYDTQWCQSLEFNHPQPELNEFLRIPLNTDENLKKRILNKAHQLPIQANWDETKQTLTFSFDLSGTDENAKQEIKAYIQSKSYKWQTQGNDKAKFIEIK